MVEEILLLCGPLDFQKREMSWIFAQAHGDHAVPGVKGIHEESCSDACASSESWTQLFSTEIRPGASDRHYFTPARNGTKEIGMDVQTSWSLSPVSYGDYHRKQRNDGISHISNVTREDATNIGFFKQQASNMESYDQEINADMLCPPSSDLFLVNCEEEESSALHECGFLREKNDYQFDDLSQDDGIFQNMMLGENVTDSGNGSSFPYMPHTEEESSLEFENFLSDMLVDTSIKDSSTFDALNCLDNQLNICGKDYQVNNHLSCSGFSCTLGDLSMAQGQMPSASIPVDQGMFREEDTKLEEEVLIEAAVLHDLELSMERLNMKTRICFKDALYRLARSSRQQRAASEAESSNVAIHVLASALGNGARESHTNVIDRTVASLLFNNTSQESPDCSPPTHHEKKHTLPRIAPRNSHSKKQRSVHSSLAHNEYLVSDHLYRSSI